MTHAASPQNQVCSPPAEAHIRDQQRAYAERENMRLHEVLRPLPLILLLTLSANAQAQFTFTTNNGAVTITRYTGPGGDVTIPDTTNGLPVTGIGPLAFAYCFNLTNVTIPGSITTLGQSAFLTARILRA